MNILSCSLRKVQFITKSVMYSPMFSQQITRTCYMYVPYLLLRELATCMYVSYLLTVRFVYTFVPHM